MRADMSPPLAPCGRISVPVHLFKVFTPHTLGLTSRAALVPLPGTRDRPRCLVQAGSSKPACCRPTVERRRSGRSTAARHLRGKLPATVTILALHWCTGDARLRRLPQEWSGGQRGRHFCDDSGQKCNVEEAVFKLICMEKIKRTNQQAACNVLAAARAARSTTSP